METLPHFEDRWPLAPLSSLSTECLWSGSESELEVDLLRLCRVRDLLRSLVCRVCVWRLSSDHV